MKVKVFRNTLLIAALSIAAPILLQAAPSLSITEPPVSSSSMDGPMLDPWSTNGQWFVSLDGVKEFRTHEFYDNLYDHGGDDPHVIDGRVASVQFGGGGIPGIDPIIKFTIAATIENNTPRCYGQESNSSNSHNESRPAGTDRYIGTLLDTKLTVEFAIAEADLLPQAFTGPYQNPWPPSFIIAENEDQLAWYCWNEQDPTQGDEPGNFYVPTWDFGNIAVNDRVTKVLNFTVDPPMDLTDPRYAAIYNAHIEEVDIFANRTPSLKISTWIDGIGVDSGDPYPDDVLRSSDVSVFHNIVEPVEPPHKMHWPQLPDPFGWDVRACTSYDDLQKVLADDFRCTSNGPITHITFWGSFQYDENMPEFEFHGINKFHLSLHDDIPDSGLEGDYSKPVVPALWEMDIDPYTPPAGWIITVEQEIPSPQGWYDPNTEEWNRPDHENYYRYDVFIPESEAFVQTNGTIYWLDISVETEGPMWGWKTSRSEHFNDDAVWADLPVLDPTQWNELIDPETLESLDLAFVIDGPEEEEPEEEYDFGDAPDTGPGTGTGNYQTLLSDSGAYHTIVSNAPYFDDGSQTDQPDPEPNGQPTTNADGDDNNGITPDDEDGIIFGTLYPGYPVTVTIGVDDGMAGSAAGQAWVDAWIDFNADGDWVDAGETIHSGWLPQGPNPITISVPLSAAGLTTYARFRINSGGTALPPTGGPAIDGEVEDYKLTIEEEVLVDWGDATDTAGALPSYQTLSANNGANHIIVAGILMGSAIDAELDGQPTPIANGDDLASVPNDEDGVLFAPLIPGKTAILIGTVSVNGWLDVWIDQDGSGDWSGSSDRVYSGAVAMGPNPIPVTLPYTTAPGSSFMRFRFNTGTALPAYGLALDGEVEDYIVVIEEPEYDWGDADDITFPGLATLAFNGGAQHIIADGILLGSTIDPESDGHPTSGADGDDNDGSDDEDGVVFSGDLVSGSNGTVNVTGGGSGGMLDAWIDFDADGIFGNPSEHIWSGISQGITGGVNVLAFAVPQPSALGPTYARFRISTVGSLPPDNNGLGLIPDGEVEDYLVELYQPEPSPDISVSNLVFDASVVTSTVYWAAQTGIACQLQSTTNLTVSNSWVDVGLPIVGPVNLQSDLISTNPVKFYRLTVPWTK